MKNSNGFSEWQFAWGSPRSLFFESEGKLEIAFLFAILMHAGLLGMFWQRQLTQQEESTITLQNVDLIDPEVYQPPAPPPVVVKKPRSALEFLKMALPIFSKPEPVPKEMLVQPMRNDPKIAEPEKLLEKKMMNKLAAPEIKLRKKNDPTPKLIEMAKLPRARRSMQPLSREPALKLEEVGRRAVAVPQTPALSLNRTRRPEKAMDLASIPKTNLAPRSFARTNKLVDKAAPVRRKQPTRTVLGYKRRGGSALSLDRPREVVRRKAQPVVAPIPTKKVRRQGPAVIKISKERVKITGQLKNRKVIKSVVPKYPSWARARNIEADVAIRFTVSPEGRVRPNSVVQRTSGYPELDKLAMETLKNWRFAPIGVNQPDEWGIITFRFILE